MTNFKRLMVDAIIVIVALTAGAGAIYAVQAEAGDPIYYRDADGDGFGSPTAATSSVATAGYVADSSDCNDAAAAIHPGATEQCNGIDDDCDGSFDDGMSNFTFWLDADGDSFGTSASTTFACVKPAGWSASSTDCNDSLANVNPNALEICDLIDNDCDGLVDDNAASTTFYLDADQDGYGTTASTSFGCFAGTGYATSSTDCNDSNANVRPNALEIDNDIDDDCDGQIDEGLVVYTWYRDADGDGYGTSGNTIASTTKPSGYVSADNDCNDGNASIRPNATEIANGVDDDCDGQIDEGLVVYTWYRDADGDGFGASGNTIASTTKPSGYVPVNSDCNDGNANVHPGVTEITNDAIDNNCNGLVDETLATWYRDADGDGYGNGDIASTTFSQPAGYVGNSSDCNDGNANIKPGATEATDGVDNDCDGQVDENCVTTNWYRDADGDGYGNPGLSTQACGQPSGYVSANTDCNDGNNAIRPGAAELDDDIDNDCDGQVDEGFSGDTGCSCTCTCTCTGNCAPANCPTANCHTGCNREHMNELKQRQATMREELKDKMKELRETVKEMRKDHKEAVKSIRQEYKNCAHDCD